MTAASALDRIRHSAQRVGACLVAAPLLMLGPAPEAAGACADNGAAHGKAASQQGCVISSDGEPVAGAEVAVYRVEGLIEKRTRLAAGGPRPVIAATRSDKSGRYLLGYKLGPQEEMTQRADPCPERWFIPSVRLTRLLSGFRPARPACWDSPTAAADSRSRCRGPQDDVVCSP